MFKTILVATDFDAGVKKALDCAREIAGKFGASLHLMHVVVDPATLPFGVEAYGLPAVDLVQQWQEQARTDLLQKLTEDERSRVTVAVPVGSPYREIIQYAKRQNVDLIVLGTHGRGALAHLMLGSVAERVVRTAACAVLTVR